MGGIGPFNGILIYIPVDGVSYTILIDNGDLPDIFKFIDWLLRVPLKA